MSQYHYNTVMMQDENGNWVPKDPRDRYVPEPRITEEEWREVVRKNAQEEVRQFYKKKLRKQQEVCAAQREEIIALRKQVEQMQQAGYREPSPTMPKLEKMMVYAKCIADL